ncbi:MAG: ATP-binding protein [Eubacterium sp.]|nr:ATP-binding protein [Eubacterium sp.]
MIRKLFQQMVASQIVSAMAVTLCLLIDSIMICRFLGVDAMAAYGLTSPVLLTFAAFGSLLSTGIQVVCSKAMGSGDEKKINRCFSLSVILAVTVSLVGVALILIFSDQITTLLGAEEGTEVYRLTKRYLIGFVIGAPAFIGAQILVPFLQMSGQRVRLVTAVLTMTAVDIFADLMDVFVLKWDTLGMGLASTVSYFVAVGIGVVYFFKKNCVYKFTTKNLGGGLFKEMALGGVPTVVNQISLVLLVYIINQTMMRVGETAAVAAYSVVSTIANLGYCLGNGISEVSLMLTGIAYSEEDEKSLREIVKQQTWFAVVIDAAAMVLFLIFAGLLAKLFVNVDAASSPEEAQTTIKYATAGLRFFAICLIPSSVNAAFKKYYQAIGKVRLAEILSVAQNLAFPAVVVLGLGNLMYANWGANAGTIGVWLSYLIGETLTILFISLYVKYKTKKRFGSLDSYTFIPEGFGAAPGDALELEIFKREDVEKAALAATRFCEEKGEDKRKTMYASLSIEEMSCNILEYGFKEGKNNRIDIRLVRKENDDLILRIRDNCEGFDPVNYYEMAKPDENDPAKHIGIRMVFRMVKDVKYVNSLGLNNLTVRI